MKLPTSIILILVPALAFATLALPSCEDPSMPHAGPKVYTKLPAHHRGGAYYHQGRYYTGGQYPTGTFTHEGRQYTSRYYHDGPS